ncbi:ElyC/SanA/YdcF family protein [Allobranchiibius sp. GilTou38]|uniref:ElyC/SanA/YdcF family protein n=1 Tax=Allobranchiibius sp. GilTou38 TaxID=2815210 RepID=UPI001AA0B6F2|nr:YdcF family protein [Allobranchiibius sp. GilTou38]
MDRREAIILLGSQPDPTTWHFPRHVYDALNMAVARYGAAASKPLVITSGDRSLKFYRDDVAQPFRECDRMADHLIEHGVSQADIIRERESRDVISNLYYVKRELIQAGKPREIVLPLAHWRIPRVAMVLDKIFGAEFAATYVAVSPESPPASDEHLKWEMQRRFLEPMPRGQDTWLAERFYDSWLYHFWAECD